MIKDTIERLEGQLAEADGMDSEKRSELLTMLAALREEINELAESDSDRARSIAAFAEASTNEATRRDRDPELFELSVQGLSKSVDKLEASHPKLAQAVGKVCDLLSNLGI